MSHEEKKDREKQTGGDKTPEKNSPEPKSPSDSRPKNEIGPGKIICQKYFVSQKIGQGSFGSVYAGYDLKTSESIAIKVEEVAPGEDKRRKDILLKEAKFLYNLNGEKGFPRMIYFTKTESKRIMILSLLGRNLESLFRKCNRKFSLKTVLMLADQMISRLEYIHSKEILHRDLKPENFLIGLDKNANTIYLIDFGLSKKFIDKGVHIPFKEKVGLVGTARYTSIGSHLGNEQSRRDDLESLGYILIYFLKGGLPWMNLNGQTKEEKHKLIVNMKMATSIEKLCEGIPKEFEDYMKYVRKDLKFEEEPNYIYLKKMFRTLLINSKLDMNYVFDWQSVVNPKQNTKNPSEALLNEKVNSNGEIQEKNYEKNKTVKPSRTNLNKTIDIVPRSGSKKGPDQRLNITQIIKKFEASDEGYQTFNTKVQTSKAIFLNQTNFIDECELNELEELEEFDIAGDDEIFNIKHMTEMKINPFLPNKSLSSLNKVDCRSYSPLQSKKMLNAAQGDSSENLVDKDANEYVSFTKVRDLVAFLGKNEIK